MTTNATTRERTTTQRRPTELTPLSDSALRIDAAQDIRDRDVLDTTGERLGSVKELLIDEERQEVRFVQLTSGGVMGMGGHDWLIPVEAIERVSDDAVHVNQSRERIEGSPRYQPDLMDEEERGQYERVYDYYGYPPYWGPGYAYPMWWGRA